MGRWRIGAVLAAVAITVGVGAGSPAQAQMPVDYNFFGGIPNELAHPGGSLPGSNDWTCKPAAAHPNPVVLVHGTGGGAQTNWGTYAPLLANAGYCVYALTYGAPALPWPLAALGGMGASVEQSAAQLSAFVDRVLAATGARQVDLVGHSQGTLMPNYYAKRLGGASKIDKYVSLAPVWHGSFGDQTAMARAVAARLGAGPALEAAMGIAPALPQLIGGSAFLRELNRDGVYAPGITYTNIATRYDEIVVPYSSGLAPGANATNIVVQEGCSQDYSDHLAIAGSPRAAAYVLNALDPEHPRPVPCTFIPPFTG
ncbi:MAG: alpha/beta fold hydrolase [Mycobacteriaceae bacterium]|nr:alpha/beta fold hydrolase [Mycobacteriaceae bacterium]